MTHPGAADGPGIPRPPQAGPAAGTPGTAGPAQGSEDEFADYYRDHIRRLTAYLIYQGAAAHLAADIAQDAMITVYQRWAEIESPRPYTWRVAYRAFLRRVLGEREQPVGEVPEPAALLPRPGEAEAWLQEQDIIHVVRALSPRQRQVFALTIDGWTPAEIAELLGLDSATVRSSLKKARRNADGHRRNRDDAT